MEGSVISSKDRLAIRDEFYKGCDIADLDGVRSKVLEIACSRSILCSDVLDCLDLEDKWDINERVDGKWCILPRYIIFERVSDGGMRYVSKVGIALGNVLWSSDKEKAVIFHDVNQAFLDVRDAGLNLDGFKVGTELVIARIENEYC